MNGITLGPLRQAIADKDVELVALLWRNSWALGGDAQLGFSRNGMIEDLLPEERPGLLVAVVAPKPELYEASIQAAEELISKGPFVQKKQVLVCLRSDCTKTFERSGRKRFCSDNCRKRHNYRINESFKRKTPKYREEARKRKRAKADARRATGWAWLRAYRCAGGHRRTRENTFLDTKGSRRCRDCLRKGWGRWNTAGTTTPEPRRTPSSSSGKGGSPQRGSASPAGSKHRSDTSSERRQRDDG